MFPVAHIATKNFDLALLYGARTRHERKKAGLAHAIRSDQSHHASGRHTEMDIVKRDILAVSKADIRQTRDDVPIDSRFSVHLTRLFSRMSGHAAFGSSFT